MQSALSADTYYGSLWGLENVGQKMFVPGGGGYYPAGTADADMDVPEAWTKATGAGVTVGIVDTGLLITHPDLAAQLAANAGETGTDALESRQALQRRRRRRQRLPRRLARLGLRLGVPEHRRLRGRQHRRAPTTTRRTTTVTARTSPAPSPRSATTTRASSGVAPGAKIMALRALGANGSGSSLGDRRGVRLRRQAGPARRQRQPRRPRGSISRSWRRSRRTRTRCT